MLGQIVVALLLKALTKHITWLWIYLETYWSLLWYRFISHALTSHFCRHFLLFGFTMIWLPENGEISKSFSFMWFNYEEYGVLNMYSVLTFPILHIWSHAFGDPDYCHVSTKDAGLKISMIGRPKPWAINIPLFALLSLRIVTVHD